MLFYTTFRHRFGRRTITLRLITLLLSVVGQANAQSSPLATTAEDLVARIDLANTDYRHGKWDIDWGSNPHCYTDCSGFLDAVLIRAFHWKKTDFSNWLHSARPNAAAYYRAIQSSNGFDSVPRVSEIVAGDVLAVQYLKRTDNSGHIMIAAGAPSPHAPTPPLVPQTLQWELTIIDCSESGHGPSDTRHKKGIDGKDHPGLGKGVLRLYTRQDGSLVGFSWSDLKASTFKGEDTEPIIVGRLHPAFQP